LGAVNLVHFVVVGGEREEKRKEKCQMNSVGSGLQF
jgi:hypothetical protein